MSLSCHEGPAGMGPGCPLASGRPGTGVSFPCPFLWWPRSWDPLSTSHLCPRPVLGLCFSGGPGLTVSADPGAPGEGPQGTRGFLPVPAKPCGRECLVLASAAQTGVCSLQPCHHGAQKRLTRGLWDNAARREGRSRGGPSPCGSTRSPGGPSRAPRVPVPWPLAPPGGVFRSRRSPAAQPHPAPARGRGFRARFSRCFVSPETSSKFGSLGHESMPPLRLE